MKTTLPTRVSEAEFLSWPESMMKIELIDGDVVRSPAASYGHQAVLKRIIRALDDWAEGGGATVVQSPCDVRFGANRILQPDAFVVFQRIPIDTQGPLDIIPALCVEVLSRDTSYDRVTKRLLYAEAGVRELWTVCRTGYVERWWGAGLVQVETVTEFLATPLLPGFKLDVPALFRQD